MNVGDVFKSLEFQGVTVKILFIAPDGEHAFGEVTQTGEEVDYQTFRKTFLLRPNWEKAAAV
jgi:hypothetical protein